MSTATLPSSTRTFFTDFALTKSRSRFGSTSCRRLCCTSCSVTAIARPRVWIDVAHADARAKRHFSAQPLAQRANEARLLEFPAARLAPLVQNANAREPVPHAVRHDGAAVRQRPVPHRAHHGVHPGGHLGALPADAGTRGALRLCRRHARRADHARRGGGGHYAGDADRARRRIAPAGLGALRDQLRYDVLDALAGERRACAVDLPDARTPRPDRDADDLAVLRSGQG